MATARTISGPGEFSDARIRHRLLAWFVRRRVAITVVVFIVLIVEDVIEGIRPHDFTDIRDVKSVIGMGLVAAGMALRSWAAGILHKQSTLTTQGPYALIRNPLHVGSLLLMVGFCVLIDDGENLWFVLGPFLLLLILHVREEEQRLAIRFGASWQNYARMTPRFIPRRLESIRLDGWSFQQWINNSEYRALAATLLGLAGLASWRLLQDGALLPR